MLIDDVDRAAPDRDRRQRVSWQVLKKRRMTALVFYIGLSLNELPKLKIPTQATEAWVGHPLVID